MKYEIVGREKEIKKLNEILASHEVEFLALYGRRRVGKIYFEFSHQDTKEQRRQFSIKKKKSPGGKRRLYIMKLKPFI